MKRNQIIDLAKLIFCICVLFNHTSSLKNGIGDGYPVIMQFGFLSVEFFFIVSGFLMTKKAFSDESDNLGKSTLHFVSRKFMIIYPFFLVAWVIAFISDIFIAQSSLIDVLVHLLMSVPFHFQLQMTGIPCYDVIPTTWYISAMLICMVFMYPLIKKFRYSFVFIAAPVLAMLSYGYLGEMIGKLAAVEPLEGTFIHSGLFRGVAGMSLGSLSYGVCQKMKSAKFSKRGYIVCTVAEIASYLAAILLMFSQSRFRPDFVVVFFLFVAVTISFSNVSYTSRIFKKEHPLIGQYSLTLYLADAPSRTIVKNVFADLNRMQQIIPAFILTFVMGTVILVLGRLVKKCFAKAKSRIFVNAIEAHN